MASYAPSASVDRVRGLATLRRADGTTVCERCFVADLMLPRMKGLLGHRGLSAGEGMLIRPAPSIHTFFMRFAIDAVFLSRTGDVLKVARDVRPWRVRSCRGAYAVLELRSGEAERRGIAQGERLSLTEPLP